MCPGRKNIKSADISGIHVDAMSYDSQQRGLKRKHPNDEEDEDPPSPADWEKYAKKKQEILQMSYAKLEKFKQGPEASLFRYVLVYNTCRTLESEMREENIKIGPPGPLFFPAANIENPFDPSRPPLDDARVNVNNSADGPSSDNYAVNPYAMDIRTETPLSVINPTEAPSDSRFASVNVTNYSSEYDRYLMDFDGPSSGRATPFVRNDVDSGALWNEDSDRLTSLNWSKVLNFEDGSNAAAVNSPYSETALDSLATSVNFDGSSNSSSGCSECSVSDDAMSSSETSLHTLMPATIGIATCMNTVGVCCTNSSGSANVSSASGSTSPASGSSPTSSEDEIFGDIDLALYDYDFMPLSPPNVKMAPVSAEELMWSLSADQIQDTLIPSNGYCKKEYCSEDHLTSVRT